MVETPNHCLRCSRACRVACAIAAVTICRYAPPQALCKCGKGNQSDTKKSKVGSKAAANVLCVAGYATHLAALTSASTSICERQAVTAPPQPVCILQQASHIFFPNRYGGARFLLHACWGHSCKQRQANTMAATCCS